MSRPTEDIPKAKVYPIEAWRVFALLTRNSDPARLPIRTSHIEALLEAWVESPVFNH